MDNIEKEGNIPRIYVETSVVSGMFDDNDHPIKARPFWEAVQSGHIIVVVSDVLQQEIAAAPQCVRDFLNSLPESQVERIASSMESEVLAVWYIAKRVVGESSLNDCRHIALATVAKTDAIVSWNFRHIVKRSDKYNGVNKKFGYSEIAIKTPYEVIHDEI